jgi:hypothetical protein
LVWRGAPALGRVPCLSSHPSGEDTGRRGCVLLSHRAFHWGWRLLRHPPRSVRSLFGKEVSREGKGWGDLVRDRLGFYSDEDSAPAPDWGRPNSTPCPTALPLRLQSAREQARQCPVSDPVTVESVSSPGSLRFSPITTMQPSRILRSSPSGTLGARDLSQLVCVGNGNRIRTYFPLPRCPYSQYHLLLYGVVTGSGDSGKFL